MRTILYIISLLLTTLSYGQIRTSDNEKARLLLDNFPNHVDSTRQLTNGSKLYFVSDILFKGMILTLRNGEKIELDLRYKDNVRGYTELGIDFENVVLLKHREGGSGNPEQLRVIYKDTGEEKLLGNYPFYLDCENEIVIYKTITDSPSLIVVHDFSSSRIEKYSTPSMKGIDVDCLKIIHFGQESFTMKFVDSEDNQKELEVKRKK